ncbi:hypothetical protein ACA910_017171 [Epithemia clementina (nom. ined.)]
MSTALYRFWQRHVLHRASRAATACSSSMSISTSSSSRFLSSHEYSRRRRQQERIRLLVLVLLLASGAWLLVRYVFTSTSSSTSSSLRLGLLRRSSTATTTGPFVFVDPLLQHHPPPTLEEALPKSSKLVQSTSSSSSHFLSAATDWAHDLARERHKQIMHSETTTTTTTNKNDGGMGGRFWALLDTWIQTTGVGEDNGNSQKSNKKRRHPVFQTHFRLDLLRQKRQEQEQEEEISKPENEGRGDKKNTNSKYNNQQTKSHHTNGEAAVSSEELQKRLQQEKLRQHLEGEEAQRQKEENPAKQQSPQQLQQQQQQQPNVHPLEPATNQEEGQDVEQAEAAAAAALEQQRKQDQLRQQLEEAQARNAPQQPAHAGHLREPTKKIVDGVPPGDEAVAAAEALEQKRKQDQLRQQLEEQMMIMGGAKQPPLPQQQQQQQQLQPLDNPHDEDAEHKAAQQAMEEAEQKRKQDKLRQQLLEAGGQSPKLSQQQQQQSPKANQNDLSNGAGVNEAAAALEEKKKQDKLRQQLEEELMKDQQQQQEESAAAKQLQDQTRPIANVVERAQGHQEEEDNKAEKEEQQRKQEQLRQLLEANFVDPKASSRKLTAANAGHQEVVVDTVHENKNENNIVDSASDRTTQQIENDEVGGGGDHEQVLEIRPMTDLLMHRSRNQHNLVPPDDAVPAPLDATSSKTLSTTRLRTLADLQPLRDDKGKNNNRNSKAMIGLYPSQCPTTVDSVEITLVVQSSLDRAWILEETCRRWSDPIVAVLVLTQTQAHDEVAQYLQEWSLTCPQLRIVTHILPRFSVNDNNKDNQNPLDSNTNNKEQENDASNYPVNHLRNLGLDAVKTSHVLMVDVDFVPSQDLPNQIRQTMALRQAIREVTTAQQSPLLDHAAADDDEPKYHDALIVPAFERLCHATTAKEKDECYQRLRHDGSFLPRTFEDLRHCVLNTTEPSTVGGGGDVVELASACGVFQGLDNWEGHSSTHSSQWLAKKWYKEKRSIELLNGTSVYDIVELKCFDSLRYEPYVVVPWCPRTKQERSKVNSAIKLSEGQDDDKKRNPAGLGASSTTTTTKENSNASLAAVQPLSPYYDERFHGYGKNKIEYIQHLRFLKYQFYILPQGFLIHNPHAESKAKHEWNSKKNKKIKGATSLHQDMDHLYPQFLNELVRLYVVPSTSQDQTSSSSSSSVASFSWLEDYPGVIGLCPKTKAYLKRMMAGE